MRLVDADALIPSEVHTVVVRKLDGQEVWESVLYAEQIDDAPTITLKEYAKAEGYSIIKKKPMPKLKPCPRCGVGGRRILNSGFAHMGNFTDVENVE